jgi:hypothetical protein
MPYTSWFVSGDYPLPGILADVNTLTHATALHAPPDRSPPFDLPRETGPHTLHIAQSAKSKVVMPNLSRGYGALVSRYSTAGSRGSTDSIEDSGWMRVGLEADPES